MIYVVFESEMSLEECRRAYHSLVLNLKETDLQAMLGTKERIRKKGFHYHFYRSGDLMGHQRIQRIEIVGKQQMDIFPLFLCPGSSFVMEDVLSMEGDGMSIPHMSRRNLFLSWVEEQGIDLFNLKKGFKKGNVVYHVIM